MKHVDIAIIGAGTAGLSAYKEARKYSKKVVIIDHGPLGSTCARVGCMPSKVFIEAANQYYARHHLAELGIRGANHLQVSMPAVLRHVRQLRDRFTQGVVNNTLAIGKQLLHGQAYFHDAQTLQVGSTQISANKIIIATGSSPIIPTPWQSLGKRLLTSDTLFEQKNLQPNIAVIGAGIIGLELGQALARLGCHITLFHGGEMIGAITDPKVNAAAVALFRQEFDLHIKARADITKVTRQRIHVTSQQHQVSCQQLLAALGRTPNLDTLRLDKCGIALNRFGIPNYHPHTMQIEDTPIYIAGDVNKERPLLHEAADEGRIAGFNATRSRPKCFQRRTSIRILFTQPNVGAVGQSYAELQHQDIIIGEIDYSDQGRARIINQNKGLLRIYAKRRNGKLLGAEFIMPAGEHIAHLLSWAIQAEMTVCQLLQLPYYHPVIEEGMRTALRDLASQMRQPPRSLELAMCDSQALAELD